MNDGSTTMQIWSNEERIIDRLAQVAGIGNGVGKLPDSSKALVSKLRTLAGDLISVVGKKRKHESFTLTKIRIALRLLSHDLCLEASRAAKLTTLMQYFTQT